MAQQYVLADNMFPTEFGPSWTAHLTIVAGTDNVSPRHALADFGDGRSNCNSPAGEKTTTVNKSRVVRQVSGPFPCLDQFNTIAQVLDTAAIPWKYYVCLLYTSLGQISRHLKKPLLPKSCWHLR